MDFKEFLRELKKQQESSENRSFASSNSVNVPPELITPPAEALSQHFLSSAGLVPLAPANSATPNPMQQCQQAVMAPINNNNNLVFISPNILQLLSTQSDSRQLPLQQPNTAVISPNPLIGHVQQQTFNSTTPSLLDPFNVGSSSAFRSGNGIMNSQILTQDRIPNSSSLLENILAQRQQQQQVNPSSFSSTSAMAGNLFMLAPNVASNSVPGFSANSVRSDIAVERGHAALGHSEPFPEDPNEIRSRQNDEHMSNRKRLKWTAELHEKFEDAVRKLGGPRTATPKQILDHMKEPVLTIFHVKSHLQKYRSMRQYDEREDQLQEMRPHKISRTTTVEEESLENKEGLDYKQEPNAEDKPQFHGAVINRNRPVMAFAPPGSAAARSFHNQNQSTSTSGDIRSQDALKPKEEK